MKRQVLISVAVLAALGGLVAVLVALFQTENVETPVGSTTTIVAAVETNHRFQQPAATAAEALILTCLSEIPSNVTESVQPASSPGEADAFRVTVSPALDEDDSAKVRGCLHDFILPNVIGRAVSIDHAGRTPAS